MPPCYLYFGCRDAAKDFYYQQEWQAMLDDGILAADQGLVCAFSRHGEKVYVTHKLRQNQKQLWSLIQKVIPACKSPCLVT